MFLDGGPQFLRTQNSISKHQTPFGKKNWVAKNKGGSPAPETPLGMLAASITVIVGCIDSLCTSTRDWDQGFGQAKASDGQGSAHRQVKDQDIRMVHACAQLHYATRYLAMAGFVGVV